MCGKTSTTTQTNTPPPQVLAQYQNVANTANMAAQAPYVPYPGELTAQINAEQNQGIGTINQFAGYGVPYIAAARDIYSQASQPLTPDEIQNYYSPYQQDVISATAKQFANMNAQQQQQVLGNAISQGALGGDRTGVAQAELTNQQNLAEAPVIAGLENQGYQSALATAAQQYQQNPMAAAYGAINAALAGQSAGLQGGQSQIGAGTLEQTTQQATDVANATAYWQQQGYPFQVAQFLAQTTLGFAGTQGSTAQTTQPAPFFGLSDERAKEDISRVGSTKDGQPLYRYRFKGDPEWHVGLIAQDVEKKHPEAVADLGSGYKGVDVKAATDSSVRKGYDSGGAIAAGLGGLFLAQPYLDMLNMGNQKGLDYLEDVTDPNFGKSYQFGGSPMGVGGAYGPFDPSLSASGLGRALAPFAPLQGQGQVLKAPPTPPKPQSPMDMFNQAKNMATGASDLYSGAKTAGNWLSDTSQSLFPGATASGADISGSLGLGMGADPTAAALGEAATVGTDAAAAGPLDLLAAFAQSGGRINYPGGLALPARNRINLPMRAGLGMPSFVRSRGYQGGGTPNFGDELLALDVTRNAYRPVQTTNMPASQVPSDLIPGDVSATMIAGEEGSTVGSTPGERDLPPQITQPADPRTAAVANQIRRGLSSAYSGDTGGGGLAAPPPPSGGYQRTILPPSERPQLLSGQGLDIGGLHISPEVGMALLSGVAGLLASPSPFPGTAIGQGLLTGLQTYGGIKGKEVDIEQRARDLDQRAQAEQDRIDQESRRYNEMTAYEKATYAQPKPFPGYQTPEGNPVVMTKNGQLLDAVTHKPVQSGLTNTKFQFKPLQGKVTDLGNPVMYSGDPNNPQMMDAVTKESIGPGSPRTVQDLRYAPIADEDAKARGHQLAIGDIQSAYKGMGYGANPNSQKVYHSAMAELTGPGGMTTEQAAEYLSAQQQEWHARGMGLSAEARTAGTREANLNIILRATDAAIPAAKEQADKVASSRTGFVPLDRIIVAGKIATNNIDEQNFGMANLQLAEHWARAMNPTGQMRESDRDLALQYLSTAKTAEAYKAGVDQLQRQIQREKGAVDTFRQQHGASAPMGKSDGLTYNDSVKEIRDRLPANATPTAGTSTAAAAQAAGFSGRTATGPGGQKLRETSDGRWVQ